MKAISVSKKRFRDPGCKTFSLRIGDRFVQGIVVLKEGKFSVFENLCRHLPVTLDFGDGNFFSHDGKYLQCHRHGAMYEIESGLCVEGPCPGKRLNKIPFELLEDAILIKIPDEAE